MSQAMRKVIAVMFLIKEVYFIFDIYLTNPEVFSKVFKYNQSFITVTESQKSPQRKKTHSY